MTQEDILKEVLSLKSNNILLELSTGMGKSKLALDKSRSLGVKNILLVVNRNIHKQNWEIEINKWWPNCSSNITMTTYKSLHKHVGTYDMIIWDEAHHLSERCREIYKDFSTKYNILLSATVDKSSKQEFHKIFNNLTVYKRGLREAIDNKILPDPKVFLIPLDLKSDFPTECIIKNPKAKGKVIEVSWYERWNYIKQKNNPIKIYCTQKQYLTDLNSHIDFWKNKYMRSRSDIAKNKWLRLCSDRLKWLSNLKTKYVKNLIQYFYNNRTLVFCNNIAQTEELGSYCINSKNKDSNNILSKFNNNEIQHITACDMLNEGINLYNCQVGIYACLNSSETMIIQKQGRLLRHPNPVIVIPYYKNTRDEELVKKMKENYNPKLINIVTNYKDIRI